MTNLIADAEAPPRAAPEADPFGAAAAHRSRIDRHRRRNARRKRRLRVLRDASLAVAVSAAAFIILQIAAYHGR